MRRGAGTNRPCLNPTPVSRSVLAVRAWPSEGTFRRSFITAIVDKGEWTLKGKLRQGVWTAAAAVVGIESGARAFADSERERARERERRSRCVYVRRKGTNQNSHDGARLVGATVYSWTMNSRHLWRHGGLLRRPLLAVSVPAFSSTPLSFSLFTVASRLCIYMCILYLIHSPISTELAASRQTRTEFSTILF